MRTFYHNCATKMVGDSGIDDFNNQAVIIIFTQKLDALQSVHFHNFFFALVSEWRIFSA